jgi:hypothetical protein
MDCPFRDGTERQCSSRRADTTFSRGSFGRVDDSEQSYSWRHWRALDCAKNCARGYLQPTPKHPSPANMKRKTPR